MLEHATEQNPDTTPEIAPMPEHDTNNGHETSKIHDTKSLDTAGTAEVTSSERKPGRSQVGLGISELSPSPVPRPWSTPASALAKRARSSCGNGRRRRRYQALPW